MPPTAKPQPGHRKPRGSGDNQNDNAPFAKAFRELTAEYTHQTLADELDCAVTTISYLAHGQRPPSAKIISAIRDKYPAFYPKCFVAAMQQIGGERAGITLSVDNMDPDQIRLSMLLSMTWPEMSTETRKLLAADLLKLMRSQGWDIPR